MAQTNTKTVRRKRKVRLLTRNGQYYDYNLLACVVLLTCFGLIMLYSTSAYDAQVEYGSDTYFLFRQALFSVGGLAAIFVFSMIDYHFYARYAGYFYLFSNLLLLVTKFIGHEVNGAKRWIYFGPIGIQPSEFTKIIMIICLSKLIDKNRDSVNNISILAAITVLVMIPILLIQRQPSLSASLVLLAIYAVELFAAGLDYKYIWRVAVVVLPILIFILWDVQNPNPILVDKIFHPHQIERILTFVNPSADSDAYYQTMKSINAIGSGQLAGKGLYEGTLNQLSYLPEPQNDFIFSVIGEEFGFIGCMGVLILEFFVVFRCMLIAINCTNSYYRFIAIGIAGMFAFQTFVNTGVATGILPNTGMSLPFVSYGGSSMWTNMAAVGLAINIGLKRSKSLFEEV